MCSMCGPKKAWIVDVASVSTLVRDAVPIAKQLLAIAHGAGLAPRCTSARRSSADQARLYRDWKAGRSRFPAAPPGASLHEQGLAFDLALDVAEPYRSWGLRALGELWERAGFTWGGRFNDPIHFDFRPRGGG